MKESKLFGMMVAQITTHVATAKTTRAVVTKGVRHPAASFVVPKVGLDKPIFRAYYFPT
jgi:hypothetical protein